MRNIWAISIVLALTAGTAQAQQLAVRSGDHPTFSRLTLPLPQGQQWRATRTAAGIDITLPGFSRGFDLTDVFLRMKKSRVGAIETSSDTLTLKVVCECDATAFVNGPLLVVDIADNGTRLAGPAITGGAGQIRPVAPTTAPRPKPTQSAKSTPAVPWIGRESPFIDMSQRAAVAAPSEPEPTAVPDTAELLTEIQENLVRQVANAASAGLLESNQTQPASVPDITDTNADLPALEPKDLPDVIRSSSLNVRITSSMDFPEGLARLAQDAGTSGLACPDNSLLSLADWGDDTGFSAQIGPARDALVDALDKLDPEAIEKLARLYLYFGFGAEALGVLHLDDDVLDRHSELVTLAHIFEHGTAGRSNPLADFTDCPSDAALWSTISLREIPPGTLIDTNATLRAVNKLPKHLRQIAAPLLSARLLDYGDAQSAATAMRSIERLPDPPTPQAVMAQADIAIDAGEPAAELLQEVVDTNTQQSPEALVKLVNATLAKDEPLSYETATLIEAYAQELRGTEMGSALRRTQVAALSQAQHFDEAFRSLADLEPSLSPDASAELRKTVLEHLGKKADDLTFLEHLFAQEADAIAHLPQNTKLLMATRLMDLGFGAQVQDMIGTIPDRPRVEARQILAARAALQLRQPFQAQAALIGIETPQATLLLAQAKEMAGEYREAFELFSESDSAKAAKQAAWLSDDWQELTPQDASGFGAAASLLQAPAPPDDPLIGQLGRADLALEESAAARSTLEQLLADPDVQVSADF